MLPEGNYLSAPLLSTYQTRTVFEIPVVLESVHGQTIDVLFDLTVVGRSVNGIVKCSFYPGKYTLV